MASRPTKTNSRAGSLRDSNKENAHSVARPRLSNGKDDITKPTISPRAKDADSRTSPSLSRARAGTTSSVGKATGGSIKTARTSTTTSGSAHSPTTSTSTAPKLAKFAPSPTTKASPTNRVLATTKATISPASKSKNASGATSAAQSAAPRVMSAATRKALERRAQQSQDVEDSNEPLARSAKPRKTPSPSKFFRIPSPARAPNSGDEELASTAEQDRQAAIKQAQEDALTADERSRLLKSPLLERVGSFASFTMAGESPVMDPTKSQNEEEAAPAGRSLDSTQGLAIDMGDIPTNTLAPSLSPSEAKANEILEHRPSTPSERPRTGHGDTSLEDKEGNTTSMSPLPSPSREIRPTPSGKSPGLRGGSTMVFQDVERQLVSVKAQFASTSAGLKTQLNEKTTDLEREQRNLKELEQRFEKIMYQNVEFSRQKDFLEREQASFRNKLDQCNGQIEELERSIKQLENANNDLKVDNDDLAEKYTRASKNAAEGIEALHKLEAEVVELRGQLKELSTIPGGLSGLFEQIRILTEGFDNLNECANDANERCAALLMDRDICSGEVDRLRARLLDADRHVEAMKDQITQAIKGQDNAQAERNAETLARQENERHLNHLWYMINSLRTEVKSRLDSDATARLHEQIQDESQSLSDKDSVFRNFQEVEALVHQCSRLGATISQLEGQLSQSGQSSYGLEKKIDELSTEVLELRKQNEKLKDNVETMWSLDQSLERAKEEITAKTTELDTAQARISALESERWENRTFLEKLQAEKSAISSTQNEEASKLRDSYEKLRAENESLTSQIGESNRLKENLENDKKSLVEANADEMRTLREKSLWFQKHAEESARQLEESDSAHEKLQESFRTLQKEHTDLPSQVEKKVTDLLTQKFDQEKQVLKQAHANEIRRLEVSLDALRDGSSQQPEISAADEGGNNPDGFENEKQQLVEMHSEEIENLRRSIQALQGENVELKGKLELTKADLVKASRSFDDVIESDDSAAFASLANHDAIDLFTRSWKQAVLSGADENMISRLENIPDRMPDEIMVFVVNCGRDRLASHYSGRKLLLHSKLVDMMNEFCLRLVRRYTERVELAVENGAYDTGLGEDQSTNKHDENSLLNVVLKAIGRADKQAPYHSGESPLVMSASDLELSETYYRQFEAARKLLAKVKEFRELSSSLTTYDGVVDDVNTPELTRVRVTCHVPPYTQELIEDHTMTLRRNEDYVLLAKLQEQRVNTNLAFGKVTTLMDDLRQLNGSEEA